VPAAVSTSDVVAVVVTWNRRDLLAEALRAVLAQHPAPARVIVVDNASDDGTGQLLTDAFPSVEVVATRHNTGGAGGFAIGVDRALRGSSAVPTALWLMDDDTIPEAGALGALIGARQAFADPTHPARPPTVVASRVVWTDGRDHPMNTPREKPGISARERSAAAAVECMAIRSASFVSILVDGQAAVAADLPVADYFLWNDDFEYTTRLLRGRIGLWCPASVVVHKTKAFGSTDADPGERFYFEVRNKVWLFTRSPGLSPAEKAMYAGSTLRRWVRTVARSEDRGTLLRGLLRGLVAAARHGPAPTSELIATAVVPTAGEQERRDG